MMRTVIKVLMLGLCVETTAATVRYEDAGLERPVVATGVEKRGEVDGSRVRDWDTTVLDDGWTALSSGGLQSPVLVLNGPRVAGGPLTTNEFWSADRLVVVRDDVVVPAGVTLTLGYGAKVKFLPAARFVVEEGGALRAEGAALADFADDGVDGDTNFDGDDSSPSGGEWWTDDAATAALVQVSLVDGAREVEHKRSYTEGVRYGELPQLTREGFLFDGWFTDAEGGEPVTEDSTASSAVLTLYAHWTPMTVTLDPTGTNVTAQAGYYAFELAANAPWTATCDADWVALAASEGDGDATFDFSVSENASLESRAATIRVALSATIFRDFTVSQAAMTQTVRPTVTPADGTEFTGASRRVTLKCEEADAEIRYTLDGTEPTVRSMLYQNKSFNVFDTTVVKAKAFKPGQLPSETAVSRIIRLETLAEAIDQPLWTVITGGDVDWTVDTETSHDGKSSALCAGVEPMEASWMETTIEGAGTLSFRWRVICEDDPDNDCWDFLMLEVDDMDIAHLDGDSGWQTYTVKVKGDGMHRIRWTFSRDDMDDVVEYDNVAWVDQVTWSPFVGDAEVPKAWLDNLGIVSADGSMDAAAKSDTDGDGFTAAEEYMMGTDPNDAESRLMALIEIVDDKPVVTYTPDLLDDRKYIKWGKKKLDDQNEEWTPVEPGKEVDYNFFKVSVEMP